MSFYLLSVTPDFLNPVSRLCRVVRVYRSCLGADLQLALLAPAVSSDEIDHPQGLAVAILYSFDIGRPDLVRQMHPDVVIRGLSRFIDRQGRRSRFPFKNCLDLVSDLARFKR